jgi:hypothetical protein
MTLLTLALLHTSPALAADTYTLVGSSSTVHAMLDLNATALSDATGQLQHALRLNLMEGTLTLEGDAILSVAVDGTVASLAASQEIRTAAGLKGALSEGNVTALMGCVFKQLAPERDNHLRFQGSEYEGSFDDLKVTGTFSMNETTQTVTVPMKLVREGDQVKATGTLTLNVPDYGFRIPGSGWSVKDEARAELELVFAKE